MRRMWFDWNQEVWCDSIHLSLVDWVPLEFGACTLQRVRAVVA